MSFKVSFIGAGSLVFARTLFTDIVSVPEFHDIEISFTDINATNLERARSASVISTRTISRSRSRRRRTAGRPLKMRGTS